MGFDLPNHLFPLMSELSFAPMLDDLRPISSGRVGFDLREDLDDLVRAYLWGLSYMNQRTFSCVWCQKGESLLWTKEEYSPDGQIEWRQPFSIGVTKVDYHLYARTTSVEGAELRIQGANGGFVVGTIPAGGNPDGGEWHLVKILGVDCGAFAPQSQYFTPILQGRVKGSGAVYVASMASYEQPMSNFPEREQRQFVGPVNENDPNLAGESVTLTPAIPVPVYEVLDDDSKFGGVAEDNPLSADTMAEIINGALTLLTRRTRISYLQILPSGQGSHPDYFWVAGSASFPRLDVASTNHLARIRLRQPSGISGLGTKFSIHVRASKIAGSVDEDAGIRFIVRRIGAPGRDPTLELTWDRNLIAEGVFQWKTGVLDVPFIPALGNDDDEMWITGKGGVHVESILVYAEMI